MNSPTKKGCPYCKIWLLGYQGSMIHECSFNPQERGLGGLKGLGFRGFGLGYRGFGLGYRGFGLGV